MKLTSSVPAYKLYLFDVDGTLTQSHLDICGAIQQVIAPHLNGTQYSDEFLSTYIGRHLIDLFEYLFPDYSPEQIEALIQEYRQVYPSRNHASTIVYPGVRETLSQLQGPKATATTKATSTTRIVLEKFDLHSYFDHIQGTDGFPAKPAPDVLLKSLQLFGIPPEECLFIGDSAADMEAGSIAGVKLCAVTYGYGNQEEMARFNPEYWVDDLRSLLPKGLPEGKF